MSRQAALHGWGRTNPSVATVHRAGDDAELTGLVTAAGRRGVLARGLGRSYGDAAQNAGGVVVDMATRDRVLAVDTATAVVQVEAGVSMDSLMRLLLPRGLFVPVTPGTRQVSVGGAIAADIHGKNHHVDGSFGRYVLGTRTHGPLGVVGEDPQGGRCCSSLCGDEQHQDHSHGGLSSQISEDRARARDQSEPPEPDHLAQQD